MACDPCDWRYYRRINDVMFPLLIVIIPVALLVALVTWQAWWVAVAAGSFVLGAAGMKLGGLYWWGGHRCRRCGKKEEYR